MREFLQVFCGFSALRSLIGILAAFHCAERSLNIS